MEQGSTIDSKQSFDFADGDWSVRTEPFGPFCVWHGYHGPCPECGDKTPPEAGIPTVPGEAVFPWVPGEQWFVPDDTIVSPAPPLVEHPTRVSASVIEQIRSMFPPTEAELRGRRVHEQALELAEATGVPYAEAIDRVLGAGA